ncbi:hypothetical protein [Roseivirga sp.]|uniref:hypothetical protein n=1 Tax=Roseivirga sp. TaxID=1964215 RepID=UPI003B8D1F38
MRFRTLGVQDTSRLDFIDLGIAKDHGVSLFYPTLIELNEDSTFRKALLMNAEDSSDWKELNSRVNE